MTDPVRRVHYFAGQLLGTADLQAEQDYHRGMRYLHNQILGSGVADGLAVSIDADDDSAVVVSPGVAIDPLGREIVLVAEVRLDVSAVLADPDSSGDVTATWEEVPADYVVTPGRYDDERAFTRWLEQPRIAVVPSGAPTGGSVILARVVRPAGGAGPIAVDLSRRQSLHPATAG